MKRSIFRNFGRHCDRLAGILGGLWKTLRQFHFRSILKIHYKQSCYSLGNLGRPKVDDLAVRAVQKSEKKY
jgi:hypothetical protein